MPIQSLGVSLSDRSNSEATTAVDSKHEYVSQPSEYNNRWRHVPQPSFSPWYAGIPGQFETEHFPANDHGYRYNFDFTLNSISKLNRSGLLFSHELIDRLYVLKSALEQEREPAIKLSSLKSFEYFLFIYPDMSKPEITITPNSNLRAEWKKDRKHHLAIEFINNNQGVFVIFAPSRNSINGVARVSGIDSVREIIQKNRTYGILEWFKNYDGK